MDIHLIWAQDENGGIGINGKLPWHISEDLKNFKSITNNSIIIMGRKTWDSLPFKPLPNRRNIVFSKNVQCNTETFSNFDDCLNQLNSENIEKVFIIGGRSIYKLFYNKADFLHITNVNLVKEGIDEFFPINYNQIKKDFKKMNEKTLSKIAMYSFWMKK